MVKSVTFDLSCDEKRGEVLRLASLKPELQRNNHQRFLSHLPSPYSTSTIWTYTASLVLRLLSLVGTQAATGLPQVVYLFLVHSCVAYLLPQTINHANQ
jgi:hypothetical protein